MSAQEAVVTTEKPLTREIDRLCEQVAIGYAPPTKAQIERLERALRRLHPDAPPEFVREYVAAMLALRPEITEPYINALRTRLSRYAEAFAEASIGMTVSTLNAVIVRVEESDVRIGSLEEAVKNLSKRWSRRGAK